MPNPDLLTPAKAGALLGVSDETMRRWAAAGKIRHVRLPSGKIRFHRDDVTAALITVDTEPAA